MPYARRSCSCGKSFKPRANESTCLGCRNKTLKILIIPDVQAKPGVDLSHLSWVGQYIADKRPEIVVCIGDFADMPSLSSYDRGKKTFEGRRYKADIDASIAAMTLLMAPIQAAEGYVPRLVMTIGNHEDRITRAVNDDPKLDGTIGLADLQYERFGWEVHDFLDIVEIGGIAFSHYFTSGVMGRPVTSANALLRTRMGSAVMGHVQFTDAAFHQRTGHLALFVGTCYLHDEEYLTQANTCRRQVVMLHEVKDGMADPMFVSLNYLRRKYGAVAR